EPTHGSAPKYAGLNKANPIAQILSGMLMLRHLGETDAADRLEGAIADLIREGTSVTYDMKEERDDPTAVGTADVAAALIAKRQAGAARRSRSSAPGTSARPARRRSPRATTPTSCSSTSRRACRRARPST